MTHRPPSPADVDHDLPGRETVRPDESAAAAGLRYCTDSGPGIRRHRTRSGFRYTDPAGRPVRDPATLQRIRSLAIPPAWTDVWIAPDPRGHLQATGRDKRGRKQYRYHPRWRAARDETKYGRMLAFARALTRIREAVEQDLGRRGLPREKVLAGVVKLLETTLIRVGNEAYVRQNKSFGLTTMLDRHVDIDGARLRFRFRGKSGVRHEVELSDRRLAAVVKRCQDIPGQTLFQYVDDDGNRQAIDSADVNDYLRRISGHDFTAKDFRTWAGTVLAARALHGFERFDSETQAKQNIVRAIERVAERLGNTSAICRKYYVHPAILNAYIDGTLAEHLRRRAEAELAGSLDRLPPEEAAVLAILQQGLG